MSSPLEALFVRALDLDDRSRALALRVVGVLVVVHAAMVTPWVGLVLHSAATQAENERLATVDAGLHEIEAAVARVGERPKEEMTQVLARLVVDLRHDLARVAATRDDLRRLLARERGTEPPAGPEGSGVPPFEVENVDWIVSIGEAADPETLAVALMPLVGERVIRPRFGDLQHVWSTGILPALMADLDEAAGRLPELRGRFPEAEAEWEGLTQSLQAARRTLRDLEWRPPERADWWASAEVPAGILGIGLAPEVEEQLRQPLALDQAAAAHARVDEALRALTATLAAARGDGPGKGGGQALRRVTPVLAAFPLILGLSLAAVTWRCARRRQELTLVTRLLLDDGASPGLSRWFRSRLSGSFEPDGDLSKPVSTWVLGHGLGLAAAALGWIGLAAFQVSRLPTVPPLPLAVAAVAGALAVVSAAVLRWRSQRAALDRVQGTPSASPSAPVEPQESEVLDGHDLQR